MSQFKIVDSWYQGHFLLNFLKPFSLIFVLLTSARRRFLQKRSQSVRFKIPIIVVGNLTVGGSGKTPFVIWLANTLKQHGYKPGIISRGYGGKANDYPFSVSLNNTADKTGDEPLLIHKQTDCPVVVDPVRVRGVQYLLAQYSCDVVISDDGLQHYRLPRDIEIVVIDGARRFGNGWCLPAGPLREPVSRLSEVDFIVSNGESRDKEIPMALTPLELINLKNPNLRMPLTKLEGSHFHAVAAIGNPVRFFNLLQKLGAKIHTRIFPDHHLYQKQDLVDLMDKPLIMTEKDAVKCKDFAGDNWWYLPVYAKLPDSFADVIIKKLKHLITLKAYLAEGTHHG